MDYSDRFDEMALFYLEMADYNFDKAYQEYCSDRDATKGKNSTKIQIHLT